MYVVISTAMNGEDVEAIFSSRKNAEAYLRERDSTHYNIAFWNVGGDYEYPAPVFVSQQYDEIDRAFKSEGLYSSWKAAKRAAGHKGHTKKMCPDSRMNSGISEV